jgi:hypothetical protein
VTFEWNELRTHRTAALLDRKHTGIVLGYESPAVQKAGQLVKGARKRKLVFRWPNEVLDDEVVRSVRIRPQVQANTALPDFPVAK